MSAPAPIAVLAPAGAVGKERTSADGRIAGNAVGVAVIERELPMAVLPPPVVLLKSAQGSIGRVVDAGCVAIERLRTVGCVGVAGGVAY